jgi:hypothetical protein
MSQGRWPVWRATCARGPCVSSGLTVPDVERQEHEDRQVVDFALNILPTGLVGFFHTGPFA